MNQNLAGHPIPNLVEAFKAQDYETFDEVIRMALNTLTF